jgi:hypothetical protein
VVEPAWQTTHVTGFRQRYVLSHKSLLGAVITDTGCVCAMMQTGQSAADNHLVGIPVTLDEVLVALETAPRRDPLTLRREDVPSAPGIYVWYRKTDKRPFYVGRAAGRKGLRHRIWAQHLNPAYLEGRAEKINQADWFQFSCAVVVRGQPRIDKSVFRRNVGRRERIGPGQPTVDFIRERLELAWVVLPQSDIALLERDLIAQFAAEGDLYNLSGNPAREICKFTYCVRVV